MKIKLKKDWRAFGQINKAGKTLKITNENLLEFLKENNYIDTNEKKSIKKEEKKDSKTVVNKNK